jgi:hypothetical protein
MAIIMSNQIPEEPRSEPEIIPPDRPTAAWAHRTWMRSSSGFDRESQRIYVAKLGPFSLLLLLLVIGLLIAAGLVFVLGAVLVWIPVAVLLAAAAVLGGALRWFMQRR